MFGEDLSAKTLGVWGLAFKPDTNDVREAPALYLLHELAKRGAKMKAYDPEARETFKKAASDLVNKNTEYVDSPNNALNEVDALVICTEWSEFRVTNLEYFKNYMDKPIIFDGRNLYDLEKVNNAGWTYISVGRPRIN